MDESPAPLPAPPPTWHDNQKVLRLVRIGFFLQFSLPAIVCGLVILAYILLNLFGNHFIHVLVLDGAVLTLGVLGLQYSIFARLLRSPKRRSAGNVLRWLVGMNVVHGATWLFLFFPVTIIRLMPPIWLYMNAIRAEESEPS